MTEFLILLERLHQQYELYNLFYDVFVAFKIIDIISPAKSGAFVIFSKVCLATFQIEILRT